MRELLTGAAEAHVFAALQRRLMVNRVSDLWRRNRLRFIVVGLLSGTFWGIVLYLFQNGFQLLATTIGHQPTRAQTVHTIFNVFFASLLVMITISSSVIFFSTAYRGRDIPMLLVQPVRPRRIALLKLQEAMLFGGWGFFLLGSPMLWAYGIASGAPWYYYPAVIPFMVAFVAIPVAVGCIFCLIAIRYLPRYHTLVLVGICLLLLVATVTLGWSVVRAAKTHDAFSVEWLDGTLARLRFSDQPGLPSWWLSSGLLEAAHPAVSGGRTSWQESLGFFVLLASTALMLYITTGRVAEHTYATGFCEMVEIGRPQAVIRSHWLDGLVHGALCILPRDVRVLFAKDLRIFARDILQWSQFAVFSGLLGLYFLNIRRLQSGARFVSWIVIIGFLNIGVVGLLWATFTTRFVYPLLSLEGRRFWVLGTLPISRGTILWSKFLFATMLGVIPCSLLILLSDIMLGVLDLGGWLVVVHQITSVSLCFGLAGIAVGLGAWLPNLHESSPAKIATGFGGTLTLVLSVVFILVTVMTTAMPVWSWSQEDSQWHPSLHAGTPWIAILGSPSGLTAGIVLTIGLGCLATAVPLLVGKRSFERLEL